MIDKQSLGRNCHINGNCQKRLKFVKVALIHGFRKYWDSSKKSTASTTTPCPGKKEATSFSTISLAFLDRFL